MTADKMHRLSSYRNNVTRSPKSARWKRAVHVPEYQGEELAEDDDADRGVRASRKHICSRRRQELITGPLYRGYDAAAVDPRADRPLSSALRLHTSGKFAILIGRGRGEEA